MSGRWRKNESETRSTPLDPNALKLHNLAKTATKLDRDCRAILPRINWTKPSGADRCRELIGVKFSAFLATIVEASKEFDATTERVYRNIISWSPGETLPTLFAVAKWDSRQDHPILEGLSQELVDGLLKNSAAPYWLMDQEGPVSLSDLEQLLPNHPTIVLRAHFNALDGSRRRRQQSLIKDLFKAAGGLDWEPSKSSALECLSGLLREHKVTAKFSKSTYFALSNEFQEHILERRDLYPELISESAITEIEEEIERREIEAAERYKKTSPYLASVVAAGDFNSPEFLSIVQKAQSSSFHNNALNKGIKACRKVGLVSQDVLSTILNLPDKQSNISLKLLACDLKEVIQSISTEDHKAAIDGFLQLNSEQQERAVGQFNLKKLSNDVRLSKGAYGLVQVLIQRQLSKRDDKVSALGTANALIAVQSHNLNIDKSIRQILDRADGAQIIINSPQKLELLLSKFSTGLQKIAIQKIQSYRAQNLTQWGAAHAKKISKHFPDLLFKISRGMFVDEEVYELIKNGWICELLEHTDLSEVLASQGWRRNLGDWNSGNNLIPSSVIKLASKDKLVASDLVRFAAQGLQEKHLKKLPLQVVAAHHANRAELCSMVDSAFSERARVALIPWARGNWQEKPAYAAAMEIALAFGFKHATFLGLLSKQIRPPYNEAERGKRFDKLYRTYEIPKKSGGMRVITEPIGPLKSLQKSILEFGLNRAPVHPSATGFVRGKSIVDNAAPHANQSLVVNADIRGFFPETSFKLIRRAVDHIGPKTLSDNARWFLAELLAYNGGLPAGAPTSPAIANVILRPMDEALSKASKNIGVAYTRYADDVSFSGDKALSLLPFARQIASQLGYEFDRKKTNVFRKGRRQLVTGLVVNEKPNMAKPLRKRLRAAVHARINGKPVHWNGKEMTDAELQGRIAFLAQTQPEEARRLQEALKAEVGNE